MDAKQLTKEQRQKALNALLFLTRKRDGSIKARKCADGSSKQRFEDGYEKNNGAAPTVATDSVMITAAIAAHQHCDLMTIDLPGANLHTNNDEETIILLSKESWHTNKLKKDPIRLRLGCYCPNKYGSTRFNLTSSADYVNMVYFSTDFCKFHVFARCKYLSNVL